ncbi:MAG: homoserine dehydrogenase [Desulfomonilaceae bacterium]
MDEIAIGLIGFGTIGSGLVHILNENRTTIEARTGFGIKLKRIADLDITSDRGVLFDKSILTRNAHDIIRDPEISIVVELIGGYEPARTFIIEALQNGKSVVTANKALLAEHGQEIFHAATKNKADIAFEAAVAGGIPILRSFREGLIANKFDKILAILNGTCNFILSEMTENPGAVFDEALLKAQRLGYAEADPALDIEGIDSAHKLTLVLGLTHGIHVPIKSIHVEGITGIEPFDLVMAREFSYKIKLLALIIRHGNCVEARLHPTMLPESHPLSQVNGVFNGIFLRGDMVGDQLFYGRGAGREPTASAVIGDIIELIRNRRIGKSGRVPPLGYPVPIMSRDSILDMNKVITNYYIRIQAADRPGVLSRIAGIMADHNISIHSVVQKRRDHSGAGAVPVVFITHSAKEADLQQARREIGDLDVVNSKPTIIRIEDEDLD